MAGRELRRELAEHHHEIQIRLEELGILRSQTRGIHGELGWSAFQHGEHLTRDLRRHVRLRLYG